MVSVPLAAWGYPTDSNGTCGVDFFNFTTYKVACHVEVMDGHIQKNAARDLNVFNRRCVILCELTCTPALRMISWGWTSSLVAAHIAFLPR